MVNVGAANIPYMDVMGYVPEISAGLFQILVVLPLFLLNNFSKAP